MNDDLFGGNDVMMENGRILEQEPCMDEHRYFANSDPVVQDAMLFFCRNMVGAHTYFNKYLETAISTLNTAARREYFRSLFPDDVKESNTNGLDAAAMAQFISRHPGALREDVRSRASVAVLLEKLYRERARKVDIMAVIKSHERLSALQKLVKLADEEMVLVLMYYAMSQYCIFSKVFGSLSSMMNIKLVSVATGLPLPAVRDMMNLDSKVRKIRLIYKDEGFDGSSQIVINSGVRDYIAGLWKETLVENYCMTDEGETLPVDSFGMEEESVGIVKALLNSGKPAHILLYGAPGTGKTEFSRTMALDAGRRAMFVRARQKAQSDYEPEDRRWRMCAAAAFASESGDILVIDESDELLNTDRESFGKRAGQGKAWVNAFLDESRVRVIWITNDISDVPESTLRRFAYSLPFHPFTTKERIRVWKHHLREHPLKSYVDDRTIALLSEKYQVNAAGITSALSTLGKIYEPEKAGDAKVRRSLDELLKRHAQAIGRFSQKKVADLSESYDLSVLNVDVDADAVAKSLAAFAGYREANGREKEGNVNLLFWGLPGTGKTEFAKYLARRCGMDLLVYRASDLLNCMVGETEKNIRNAFERAERQKAILFIDEADSFFINRETAVRSWETTQTNELLTQMENHRGVLICCTNLMDHLDRAVMRRFAWKVNFKPLTIEGRRLLFSKMFDLDKALPEELDMRLADIPELTPGDMKAVWQKMRFMDAESNAETLVTALEEEVKYRSRKSAGIGFSQGRERTEQRKTE